MEEATISLKAQRTVDDLELLMESRCSSSTGFDVIDFEDLFGRFNLWCGNLGVFAKGHASLDYRLRDHPVAISLVHSLIDGIQRNINEGILFPSLCLITCEAGGIVFPNALFVKGQH
jgi:hypothetical protein